MGFILWSKLCIYFHLSQKMRDITSHSMISYEHDVLPVLRVLSIVHYTYFLNSSLWNVFFKSKYRYEQGWKTVLHGDKTVISLLVILGNPFYCGLCYALVEQEILPTDVSVSCYDNGTSKFKECPFIVGGVVKKREFLRFVMPFKRHTWTNALFNK